MTLPSTPSWLLASVSPLLASVLKLLSSRPPTSVTSPMRSGLAVGLGDCPPLVGLGDGDAAGAQASMETSSAMTIARPKRRFMGPPSADAVTPAPSHSPRRDDIPYRWERADRRHDGCIGRL